MKNGLRLLVMACALSSVMAVASHEPGAAAPVQEPVVTQTEALPEVLQSLPPEANQSIDPNLTVAALSKCAQAAADCNKPFGSVTACLYYVLFC
jgi:heat shock protein HslJ